MHPVKKSPKYHRKNNSLRNLLRNFTFLGGNLGPEKNSPNCLQTPSCPPPLAWETPLHGIFSKKSCPSPPSRHLGLLLPLPQAEKKKNIRNVHRAIVCYLSVNCLLNVCLWQVFPKRCFVNGLLPC